MAVKNKGLCVLLDEPMKKDLDDCVKAEGRPMAHVVRDALTMYMESKRPVITLRRAG